jgi:hypothetical protein
MIHPVLPVTKTILLLAACFLFSFPVFAQKPARTVQPGRNFIKGTIVDTSEKKNLHFSIIALINLNDTTLYQSVRADADGNFGFTKIPPGRYTLMVSYPRMADHLQDLTITDTSNINLHHINMITKAQLLEEVVVRAGVPIRMRGDTLEYTADSFAVKAGSNVEELLKRLPGVQVEKDGKIMAQGEEVKKILVDGDEFFSDDPKLASRYLQAGAVEKVQVFDDKSEKSKFTGIDDGTRTKTINLKLKKDKKNGYFGKISAGSNGDDFFHHEAMGAVFNGTQKISAFGLSSKTGKEGLNYQEMSKYTTQDYEVIDDGVGGVFYRSNSEYENENYYGNGLPSIQSGGAHYSDKWNHDKLKLTSNYRIKQIDASGWSNSNNLNVLANGTSFNNKSESQERRYSFMQKASGTFTFALDSFSVLKISANGNMGNSTEQRSNFSSSTNEKDILVNNSAQLTRNDFDTKKFASNISYQRKFRKPGRTLSIAVQQDYNNRAGDSYFYTTNKYFDATTGQPNNADTLNQLQNSINSYATWAGKISFSEKLSDKWRFMLEYGLKHNSSENVFNTLNSVNEKFTERVDTLSNDYTFNTTTHITGTSLMYSLKKLSVTLGGNMFFTGFDQMNNDLHDKNTRQFTNFAPQANIAWRPKQSTSLSFNYTGETVQPGVEQLQPLRRSSNRLYVQIGNPWLEQGFRHNARLYFSKNNWATGKNFSVSLNFNYISNGVTSRSEIDKQGRTVSQYINLDAIPAIYGYLYYGFQIKKYKLRPSINLSLNKNGNYNILNNETVKNESVNANATFNLQHEWKNVMTTSYRGNVNNLWGWSNVTDRPNTRSISHSHTASITGYLPWDLELMTESTFNFQPKNASFNSSVNNIQWNAWLQKKFMKNEQAVVRLAVNDILNKNNGYSRHLNGLNVYESNRLVIKRYWLLSLTWNFTKKI